MIHAFLEVAPKAGTLLALLFGGLTVNEYCQRRARARRIRRAFTGRRACSPSIGSQSPYQREIGRVAEGSASATTGKASDARSSVLT